MILNKLVAAVIVCVAWCEGVSAASYSRVFVNSGQNAAPYQYVQYGSPAVAYGAPLAQLTAAPAGSVAPLPQSSNFVPCVTTTATPCIPTQQIVPVANAGLVAYKAPVVVAKDDPPTPYQYSYVVYDDNTGDQKTQKESSDNGIVRGQYSFLQPDGYVRQVQYSADDVTGFNAVVNYLIPNGLAVDAKQAKNCDDPKSGALKEAPKPKEFEGKNKDDQAKKEPEIKEPPKAESPKPESKNPPASDDKKEPVTNAPPAKVKTDKTPAPEFTAEVTELKPTGEPIQTNAVVTPVAPPQPTFSIVTPSVVQPNAVPIGYVSYDQLLNCLQKMQQLKKNSPLTYIILPSKPC